MTGLNTPDPLVFVFGEEGRVSRPFLSPEISNAVGNVRACVP